MADHTPLPSSSVENVPPPEKTPLEKLGDYIYAQRGADVLSTEIVKNELIFTVRRDHLIPFMLFLRDDLTVNCTQLMDICGVDNPDQMERFTVVYNLLSLRMNHRVRVKVTTDENVPVPSVVEVFASAGWFERETYDLMGVYFENNPDLRRILTDYGFDGHPLRKDFPMTGFVELRYDHDQKRVVYSPVELVQDYRMMDNLSPWDGMTALQQAGDEKGTKPLRGWHPANTDPEKDLKEKE